VKKKERISSYLDSLPDDKYKILPPPLKPVYKKDSTTIAKYYESVTRYFEYRVSGYEHREKVFSWQLLSSKIIFFSVLFMLLVGVYFSYLQFKKAIKENSNTGIANESGGFH
jgi:hypothetical protein